MQVRVETSQPIIFDTLKLHGSETTKSVAHSTQHKMVELKPSSAIQRGPLNKGGWDAPHGEYEIFAVVEGRLTRVME